MLRSVAPAALQGFEVGRRFFLKPPKNKHFEEGKSLDAFFGVLKRERG